MDKRLKAVTYDGPSLGALAVSLRRQSADLQGMFVTERLLRPLLRSDPQAIARSLPVVLPWRRRAGQYTQLPAFNAAQRAGLLMQGDFVKADQILDALAEAEKIAEKKLRAEQQIVRRNEQLRRVDRIVLQLLVRVGTGRRDKELVEEAVRRERAHRFDYRDVLDAITAHAGTFTPRRATFFRRNLGGYGLHVRKKTAKYVRPWQLSFRRNQKSSFVAELDTPGPAFLSAAKAAAKVAPRKPDKAPKTREVRAVRKKSR